MNVLLQNDSITLIKANGQEFADIAANVQENTIFVHNIKIPFEKNDTLRRVLPSGLTELYTILNPVLFRGIRGIPGHFEIAVTRKDASNFSPSPSSSAPAPANTTTNITLSGNARYYSGSLDNSVNIVDTACNPEISSILQDIKLTVETWRTEDARQKEEILEVVAQIESQFSKSAPNKSLIRGLLDTLPKIGAIASLVQKLWTLIG